MDEPLPSGLYTQHVSGHAFYTWFNAKLGLCGAGWYDREAAMSENRWKLLKSRHLPSDALLSAPARSNLPAYQRYQQIIKEMEAFDRARASDPIIKL